MIVPLKRRQIPEIEMSRGEFNALQQAGHTESPDSAVYVSGDTVWHEGVKEICSNFRVTCAILFMGAAQVPEVGPWRLTMSAADGLEFARAFPGAAIVPLHFEGWQHFSESRPEITAAFASARLEDRLRWLDPSSN